MTPPVHPVNPVQVLIHQSSFTTIHRAAAARRFRRAAVFLVLALAACSSASLSPDDDPEQLLAIVARSMGVGGSAATFEVSVANMSAQTLRIRSITVNPGVPRPMSGVPVASEFTLEPGQEHSVIAEMRLYSGGRTPGDAEWPDQLAIDVAYERAGKNEGHTFRVNVVPGR